MSRRSRREASAAQAQGTTTVRELKNELGAFIASLTETSTKLRTEVQGIEQNRREIQEELTATEKAFVQATLPDLNDEKFETISAIAAQIPQLGGQSFAYFRQKLVAAREEALKEVNASLDETVDASTFADALSGARQKHADAHDVTKKAEGELETAKTAQTTWANGPENTFVKLAETVKASGAPELKPDNHKYYTPTGVLESWINYWTRGSMYRQVRKALANAGHNEGNINVIADIAVYQANQAALVKAVADKTAAVDNAQTAEAKAKQAGAALNARAKDIVSDEQILAQVQEKIIRALNTPEFIDAMAKQFGEDFPVSIPLMTAKLATLSKLEEGVNGKLAAMNANLLQVSKEWSKLDKANPLAQIKTDLKKVKRDLAARQRDYDNYTIATGSARKRTRGYQPTETVVYRDNSLSVLEQLIIWDILTSNRNQTTTVFVPDNYSTYSTDLLGINRGDYNLPTTVFDVSEDVKKEMSDIGFEGYTPGGLVFNVEQRGGSEIDSMIDNALDNIQQSPAYREDTYVTKPSTKPAFDVAADLNNTPVTRPIDSGYVTVPSSKPTFDVADDLNSGSKPASSSWGTSTSFSNSTNS